MQLAAIRSMIENAAPMILDGGLGSELDARGYDVSSALWSAELIRSHADAILQVHRAYLDAGAHCIISASYQASIPGLEAAGYEAATIQAIFRETVAIAQRARDEFLRDNPDCGYRPLEGAPSDGETAGHKSKPTPQNGVDLRQKLCRKRAKTFLLRKDR